MAGMNTSPFDRVWRVGVHGLVWGAMLLCALPVQAADDAGSSVKLEVPDDKGGALIKTIQRKNFLKAKRLELTAFLGGETLSPFVRNFMGGLNLTYHVTEVFAVEGVLGYSPSLSAIAGIFQGDSTTVENLDLKDLTVGLEEEAGVRPSTTKIQYYGHGGLVFSPLYGKFAFMQDRIVNFDIYFTAGLGAIRTWELDEDYQGNPVEFNTTKQTHIATNFGFGFRGAFNQWMAFRLEGREYFFVEGVTVGDADYQQEALNLVYYFVTEAGLSFFFPTTLH